MPSIEPEFRVAIFADCHLPLESGHSDFETFLHTFEQVAKQAETIVLLGDVFQVWAAVPVFDHENGRKLLELIESLSGSCRTIMVEGNWDFYIRKSFFAYFDAVEIDSRGEHLVFVHGHMDHLFSDRLLMWVLKSRLTCALFKTKLFSSLARKLNRKFKEGEFSKQVQPNELLKVADRLIKRFPGSDRIFAGHFHTFFQHGAVTVLPDYHSTKTFLALSDKPALYRFDRGKFQPIEIPEIPSSLFSQNTGH